MEKIMSNKYTICPSTVGTGPYAYYPTVGILEGKFGDVLTYMDLERAEKLIGKEVIGSNVFRIINEDKTAEKIKEGILVDIREEDIEPFVIRDDNFQGGRVNLQFIREYKGGRV